MLVIFPVFFFLGVPWGTCVATLKRFFQRIVHCNNWFPAFPSYPLRPSSKWSRPRMRGQLFLQISISPKTTFFLVGLLCKAPLPAFPFPYPFFPKEGEDAPPFFCLNCCFFILFFFLFLISDPTSSSFPPLPTSLPRFVLSLIPVL